MSWPSNIRAVSGYKLEDLSSFLLTAMLVMESRKRHSAHACLETVGELFVQSEDGCLMPTPAPYAQGYETTSASYYREEHLTLEASLSSGGVSTSNICVQKNKNSKQTADPYSSMTTQDVKSSASPPDLHASTTTETRKR